MRRQQVPELRSSARLREKASYTTKPTPTSAISTAKPIKKLDGFRYLIYPQDHTDMLVDFEKSDREFTYFEKLPLELRHEIIELSLPGPRTIEFFPKFYDPAQDPPECMDEHHAEYDEFYKDVYGDNKRRCPQQPHICCPTFLRVSVEYRAFVTRFYYPCFHHYTNDRSKIYINFASDTILLPFLDSVRTFFGKQPRLCPGKEYIKLIQNVALTTVATIVLRGPQFWRPLESLEKVTFVKPERMTDAFKDKMDLFRMTLNDAREQNSKKRKSKENGDDILELVLKNDFMQILNFDGLWKG